MQTLQFPRLDSSTETDSDTLVIPETSQPTDTGDGYRVILYNDDFTAYIDVIRQVIKATQCTPEKAMQVTEEAHQKGRAVCYKGAREKCHQVARVLREIRLQCEVDCDD